MHLQAQTYFAPSCSNMVGYKQKAALREDEKEIHHSHLAEYMVTGAGLVFEIDRYAYRKTIWI